MIALDRNDIAHILTGTPVICPNVIIHYYESISDATRYGSSPLEIENFFKSFQYGRGNSASQYSRGSVGISTAK